MARRGTPSTYLSWTLPSSSIWLCGTPSGSPAAFAGTLKMAQCRVSSGPDPAEADAAGREGTSASCKMSARVTAASGTPLHSMAGDTLPAGVFAYFAEIIAPSGNAGIVILIGVGTRGRPPPTPPPG